MLNYLPFKPGGFFYNRLLALGTACVLIFIPLSASAEDSTDLDISHYRLTFSETFREPLDVTPWGPSKWIAHTPWAGDFGDAAFADPKPGFPFQTGKNGLTVTARKNEAGKWESGLLSTLDPKGNGFAQAGGYFEVRMKMPPGPGTWPAFWLVSRNYDPLYHSEIDVVEYYGHGTDWYQVTLHLWPRSKEVKPDGLQQTIRVPKGSLWQEFHTYGVEILDKDIIYYLDRHQVARMPKPDAAKYPMSILVNLALGSGYPIDKTPNPSVLAVDYIKAYQRQ